MNQAAKTITKENFPLFKKLIEEVIVTATGKCSLNNPAIGEVQSKANGEFLLQIAEVRANEIANKIVSSTEKKIGGRRLQGLINAALNNDCSINSRIYTLNALSEFVLKNSGASSLYKDENINSADWKSYLKINNQPLLDTGLNNVAVKHSTETDTEIHIVSDERIEKTGRSNFTPGNEQHSIVENKHNASEPFIHATKDRLGRKIEREQFAMAGFRGGICAGFFATLIIAVIRYASGTNETILATGYENIDFKKFIREIFPLLFLFQISIGALLGWLCCATAITKNKSRSVLLFLISFFVIVLFRQLMARDAWHFPGTFPFMDKASSIRMGGGPLGEPDFETIATGIVGAIGFLILAKTFQRTNLNVPSIKETPGIILKITIYSIAVWCSVYLIYRLLVSTILQQGDHFISTSIFVFDFPHPERPIFAALLCVVYTYCIIASIKYQSYKKEL